MIVNIRGTGGAGKSEIVRRVMAFFPSINPSFIDGRRQPFGYACHREGGKTLWVPGHYETPCGGCDTVKTPDQVYASVIENVQEGNDVIFEGIIIQDDIRRCIDLHRKFPGQVLVIELTTPIEVCLAGIQSRRDGRGDERPLDPKNTVSRAKRVKSRCAALRDSGVMVLKSDRESGYRAACDQLGLSPYQDVSVRFGGVK